MGRFKQAVEVNAPVSACFQQWMNFEEFPRFMAHVKSVTRQGDQRFHWVVDGPLGKKLEWDAEIDSVQPDRGISWHSISEPDVGVQGAVMFEQVSPEVRTARRAHWRAGGRHLQQPAGHGGSGFEQFQKHHGRPSGRNRHAVSLDTSSERRIQMTGAASAIL